MRPVDAGVEDRDHHAIALGDIPRRRRRDLRGVPLRADVGIVDRQHQRHAPVEFGELQMRVARELLRDRRFGCLRRQVNDVQAASADGACAAAMGRHDPVDFHFGKSGARHHEYAAAHIFALRIERDPHLCLRRHRQGNDDERCRHQAAERG